MVQESVDRLASVSLDMPPVLLSEASAVAADLAVPSSFKGAANRSLAPESFASQRSFTDGLLNSSSVPARFTQGVASSPERAHSALPAFTFSSKTLGSGGSLMRVGCQSSSGRPLRVLIQYTCPVSGEMAML